MAHALVRVLGPVSLEIDGRALPLTPQQAKVVGLLAAQDDLVGSDRLIDALWPQGAPRSAPNAVQVAVSTIRRRAVEAGWDGPLIVNARSRYGLAPEVTRDVDIARALVAHAPTRPTAEQAAALLSEMDAIPIGTNPLVELEDDPGSAALRSRLQSLVRSREDLRLALLLAAGQLDEVVADGSAVAMADPTREAAVSTLATALYRQGDQVRALATLTACRERLAEEFGLEPGKELGQLERLILLQDPVLDQSGPPKSAALESRPAPTTEAWPVGRDATIDDLADRLALGRERLVTLTGPGGIGKTTVARAVMSRMWDSTQQNGGRAVLFVAAAELDPGASVVRQLAVDLDLAEASTDPLAAVTEALSRTPVLLVLDNLEHLTGAAREVDALLTAVPGLSVLATSRMPLGLSTEHVSPVPPLPVGAEPGTGTKLAPAVELFLRSATAARPTVGAGPALTALAVDVASVVGGHPLSLELAAAWLRFLDVDDVRLRLGLDMLATRDPDRPARHRSLSSLIDQALSAMPGPVVRVFAGLSLATAGARMPALEALAGCAGAEPHEAVSLLMDANLLGRSHDEDGASRYRLLPPVLEHAARSLASLPVSEAAALRDAWSLSLVDQLESFAKTVRSSLATRQVTRREVVHAAPAVMWLRDHGRPDDAVRTAHFLRSFAEIDHHAREVIALLKASLAGPSPSPTWVGFASHALASLHMQLGERESAREIAEQGLARVDETTEPGLVARLHAVTGALLLDERNLDAAEPHLAEAERIRTTLDDPIGTAHVQVLRGLALLEAGRAGESADHFALILEEPAIADFPDVVAGIRFNLALALAVQSGAGPALALLQDVVREAREIEELDLIGYAAVGACVALASTRPRDAVRAAGLGLTWLRRLDIALEPLEEDLVDKAVGTAREVLGEAEFVRCFATGAAVAEDEVPRELELLLSVR